MIFVGKNGKNYTLASQPLGKGGEGAVYSIDGMPGLVLKVYHEGKRTETRHRKLLAMLDSPLSPSAMQQVTWPVDVVYQNGSFMGYVMPAIKNGEELNVLHTDKYICTLSEKITVAKNLCAAVNSVHNAGQVIGDLNPNNINIDPNSLFVTLLDTDSYHVTQGSRTYRCGVGLPEYLPREVQEKMKNGINLETAPLPTFSKYSDYFALSVHVFALLMNGCHPFACAVDNKVNISPLSQRKPSVTAPQPIGNILNGFFPFEEKRQGFTTPVYAPDYNYLPNEIRSLFKRAFVDGHTDPEKRPTAVEWYNALDKMQKELKTCKQKDKHMFPDKVKKCPWCELENRPLPTQQSFATTVTNPPAVANTSAPITNTQTFTTHTAPRAASNTATMTSGGITESAGMFWFLTLAISLIFQAVIHSTFGDSLISGVFGSGGNGIESLGIDLAIMIGPWGFVVFSVIGTLIYNSLWCSSGQLYGYKWYHYVLSVLTSIGFSVLYIPIVYLLSFIVGIAACIFVVALLGTLAAD